MSAHHVGSPLREGDLVAGSYVVEKIIGSGGMAFVALASHTEARHRVAIKVLRPENARRTEVVKRFEREERTLSTLHSEHTLRIYGFGEHGGLPYMLLEYLQGQDLAALIKTEGPLPIDRAVEYTLQACHAIAEAHLLGIVHRDLKPGNLFLTRRTDGSPCIKVLDFGISKVSHEADGSDEPSLVTKASAIMGSPFYMSPEQMLSSTKVDPRSDIWSLGVTLFELLTKSLPFAAETPTAVCQRIMNGEPTPLRKLRPNYPKGLEATILQCLQKRPENRFANIADFAVMLGDFAPQHSQFAIQAICELIAPTVPFSIESPERAQTVRMHDAGEATTGVAASDTTVYLPQSHRGSRGVGAAMLLGASTLTFALGLGLGWVMNLQTDPTRGASAPDAGGSPAPSATSAAAARNTSAVTSPPDSPSATMTSAAPPIDLDSGARPSTTPSSGARRDVAASATTVNPPSVPASASTPKASTDVPNTAAPPGAGKAPATPNVTF